MAMHYSLVGTVDRRGYGSKQKGTICDARGPYPSIWRTLKPFFAEFDWFVVLMSRLDAYISRYGDFCANDDDDTTDYFTPCACARGSNSTGYMVAVTITCLANIQSCTCILRILNMPLIFLVAYGNNTLEKYCRVVIMPEVEESWNWCTQLVCLTCNLFSL